jgi:protein SCO1/2
MFRSAALYSLTDHTGKAVSDSDFRGRLMLVFFGYGYCPHICPTELQNIAVALDALGEDVVAVQPLFITVDPERDTVEFLAEYVLNFHPCLLGLTGQKAQTDAVAKAYWSIMPRRMNNQAKTTSSITPPLPI